LIERQQGHFFALFQFMHYHSGYPLLIISDAPLTTNHSKCNVNCFKAIIQKTTT